MIEDVDGLTKKKAEATAFTILRELEWWGDDATERITKPYVQSLSLSREYVD